MRTRRALSTTMRRCAGLAVLGSMAAIVGGCSDALTDFSDNSRCDLIFTTQGQGANPTTVLKIINRLNGGLYAQVDALNVPLVGVGSHMAPNTCELYGLLRDQYEVTLQRCEQDIPGSSECTELIGSAIVRRVDLQLDETETVEVTENWF